MRLADEGEVFGHFVIPYVDDEQTQKALSKALADAREQHQGIHRWEVASIAGECDVLLHLYLNDFRLIADLQAEVTDSHSLASSWLYAIPYENAGDAALPPGDLEFFVYLRVHRNFYKRYGSTGEKVLLESVVKLIRETGEEHLSGRVLYSLGWPDLIVHGRMSGDIQILRGLIVALQFLSFPTSEAEDTSVFIKTITVIGVPVPSPEGQGPKATVPGSRTTMQAPFLFGRNRPGLMADAIQTLSDVFKRGGATNVLSWAMNGTWDLVVTAASRDQIVHEQFHQAIRDSRETFARNGIERTQTHLLTSRIEDLETLQRTPIRLSLPVEGESLSDVCACSRHDFENLRDLLVQAKRSRYIPRGLTRTISHALSMFRHALRERSNCCDSIGALRAHAQGLETLLRLSFREQEFLNETSSSSPEKQALIATEVLRINAHLAEWCKRAGRVVREKTAGSAARLFLQVDSIVAQRGAIPKILMIAEWLMEHFYSRLPRVLLSRVLQRAESTPVRQNFAAILEPLGNVTSQPLMGLVAIPTRYAFALHLVVPQLWHEVGQYVFWAEYSPQQRARVDQELTATIADLDRSPSEVQQEAFDVDFHLRADMFADLLVFCFGFGGSLEKFFLYLGTLTANVAKHDRLHEQSWARQALALVHRLCFVAQFALLQRLARKTAFADREEFRTWYKRATSSIIGKGRKAEESARLIVDYMQRAGKREGWPPDFRIPDDLTSTVAANLQSEVYQRCLRDMGELVFALRDLALDGQIPLLGKDSWKEIEAGQLIELSSSEELQTAYREFYLEELEAQLAGPAASDQEGKFRKMATLGRSALLHIYRSEASAA